MEKEFARSYQKKAREDLAGHSNKVRQLTLARDEAIKEREAAIRDKANFEHEVHLGKDRISTLDSELRQANDKVDGLQEALGQAEALQATRAIDLRTCESAKAAALQDCDQLRQQIMHLEQDLARIRDSAGKPTSTSRRLANRTTGIIQVVSDGRIAKPEGTKITSSVIEEKPMSQKPTSFADFNANIRQHVSSDPASELSDPPPSEVLDNEGQETQVARQQAQASFIEDSVDKNAEPVNDSLAQSVASPTTNKRAYRPNSSERLVDGVRNTDPAPRSWRPEPGPWADTHARDLFTKHSAMSRRTNSSFPIFEDNHGDDIVDFSSQARPSQQNFNSVQDESAAFSNAGPSFVTHPPVDAQSQSNVGSASTKSKKRSNADSHVDDERVTKRPRTYGDHVQTPVTGPKSILRKPETTRVPAATVPATPSIAKSQSQVPTAVQSRVRTSSSTVTGSVAAPQQNKRSNAKRRTKKGKDDFDVRAFANLIGLQCIVDRYSDRFSQEL